MSGVVIDDGDDGYGSWCVVCGDVFALLLPFLQRGTRLGVCQKFCGKILWADFVHKLFKYFIKPPEKLTKTGLLGST